MLKGLGMVGKPQKLVELMGVKIKPTTQKSVLEKIENLKNNQKIGLVGLYSEFFLRGIKNPNYRDCLNSENNLQIIDGHGAFWSIYQSFLGQGFAEVYNYFFAKTIKPVRVASFYILFFLQLISNFFTGAWLLLVQKPSKLQLQINDENKPKRHPTNSHKSLSYFLENYQICLGRNLVYDIFKIASKKQWKVSIIAASSEPEKFKKIVYKLIPKELVNFYSFNPNSSLMRDQTTFAKDLEYPKIDLYTKDVVDKQKSTLLSTQNITKAFTGLEKVTQKLIQNKPDIILVCIGGASGKQEFFAEYLKQNPNTQFRLVASLGAALDHLGAGNKQKPSPRWLTNSGLEWFYRLIMVPNRRIRVMRTILDFWYFTSLEGFDRNTIKTIN